MEYPEHFFTSPKITFYDATGNAEPYSVNPQKMTREELQSLLESHDQYGDSYEVR